LFNIDLQIRSQTKRPNKKGFALDRV
jgi:hypothetical protein